MPRRPQKYVSRLPGVCEICREPAMVKRGLCRRCTYHPVQPPRAADPTQTRTGPWHRDDEGSPSFDNVVRALEEDR